MNFKNIQRRLQSRPACEESTPVSSGPLEQLLHQKGRDLWARGCNEGWAELPEVIQGSAWVEGPLCRDWAAWLSQAHPLPTQAPVQPSACGFSTMNGPVTKKGTQVHVGKVSLLPPTAVLPPKYHNKVLILVNE